MGPPAARKKLSNTQKRLLLYGLPTLAVGAALLFIALMGRLAVLDEDQDWTQIDYAALPEVDLLRRYLRIDTSQDSGTEIAGAQFLAEELRKLGLEPTVETLGPKEANVWAVLEGKSKEALVLHSHIDVYPIKEPEAWDYDPFGAVIDKAWLYGRGVFDMKSVTIVQLLALKNLIDRGEPPEMSVIFLATGSEEVGSELGAIWVLEQHPELSERFEIVLTEGGIVEPVSRNDIKYWGIEFAQKRFADGLICASSREQLLELVPLLLAQNEIDGAEVVTPEIARFAPIYGESRTHPVYRESLLEPELLLRDPNRFRQLPLYLRALFRNEIIPFPPTKDPSGDGYVMRFKLHLLPGQTVEDVRERLLPEWLLHGVTVQVGEPVGADHGSDIDSKAFSDVLAAKRGVYPDAAIGPYFLSWSATDSRFFRQRGIESFGFSPFVIFSTDSFRVDGPNERMSLPGYMSGFEIYKNAVERIAG